MSLPVGTHLGVYEILGQIGAGGMGEVYKARDPKLDRLVAIKVLPPAIAASGDMVARFEREAKAVAALNHPNILGIYDFGTEGASTYAVMELLEGESLRDRLKAGFLPAKKAIDYAQQIALGLAAAHAKGIVHRDIKPENIFITKEGRAKVLDFGIAKQLPGWATGGTEGGQNQATEALGTSPAGTEAGTVMGTVGYMAPEQVKGHPADHRADIFAFGVVLYEMLYGQRAFSGETAVQTLHAILEVDPLDSAATKVVVAPALEHLVFRCLEKDPESRYQSMKDLAYDLGHVSSLSTAIAALSPAQAKRRADHRLWLGAGAGAVLLLGLLVWGAGFLQVGRPFAPPTFTRLTRTPGTVESAFFGPDGHTVYFSERIQGGRPEIFVLRPDSPDPKGIGVQDALLLGVSASSELAILRNPIPRYGGRYRGMLAQVNGGGGAIKEVLDNAQAAVWDGPGLAATTCDTQDRIRVEFGGRIVLEGNASALTVLFPRLAPDGRHLALVEADTMTRTEVVTYDRDGKRKPIYTKSDDVNGDTLTGLAWGPGGEVWISELAGDQTGVWALTLGGGRRLLWRGEGSKALMDVAPDGRMLLAHQQVRRGVLVQRAGEGAPKEISVGTGTQTWGMSEDGQSVLLQESPIMDGGTSLDLAYLQKLDGTPPLLVAKGTTYSLSPDGQWLQLQFTGMDPKHLDPAVATALRQAGLDPATALSATPPNSYVLFAPTGAGRPFAVSLPPSIQNVGFAYLHPDGKRILFPATEKGQTTYFVIDRQGGAPRAVTQPGYGGQAVNLTPLSPDGSRLILVRGGVFYTQALEGGDPLPVPGVNKGENLLGWTPDMKGVYVRNMGALPLTVHRVDLATGARQQVFSFMPGDLSGLLFFRNMRMTPDAKVFAVSYVRKLSDLFQVDGVK